MSTLHGQLECVEHRAGVNPIEAELHLGMRGVDIVGLAGGPRAKEPTTTAAPAPAAAAAPTPKETLLGQARGASPERERKTAPYEQPIAPGRKEEREALEEKIPPKGQRGGKGEQAVASRRPGHGSASSSELISVGLLPSPFLPSHPPFPRSLSSVCCVSCRCVCFGGRWSHSLRAHLCGQGAGRFGRAARAHGVDQRCAQDVDDG